MTHGRRVRRRLLSVAAFWAAAPLLAGDSPPRLFHPTSGASALNVLSINASAFEPLRSDDGFAVSALGSRWAMSGTGTFEASVSLPSGALVRYLYLIGCDNNTNGQMTAALNRSSVDGDAEIVTELLRVATDNDTAPGCYAFPSDAPAPITIDNRLGTYSIQVRMNAFAANLRFQGIQILYTLQMSPPPAVATFGDVPKNHPYFRAVEALAASGITGGCGNGNFCPDLPVTRGALAKFLANALGLNWGTADNVAPAMDEKR